MSMSLVLVMAGQCILAMFEFNVLGRGRMFLRVCLVHWPRFVSSSDGVSYADHRRLPVHWSDDGSGVRVSHDGWPGGRVPLHLCTTR